MHFRAVFLLTFLISLSWRLPHAYGTAASTTSSEATFNTGFTAFQKGDYKAAQASFTEVLKIDAVNPTVLFNLGVTEEKQGNLGFAMGLWRKALAISPGYPPAKEALRWSRTKLEKAEIPHEVEFWESFRTTFLIDVHLEIFLALSITLFFLTGWLLLRYVGQRRRALLDEKPLPPLPSVAFIFAFLFCAALALSGAKVFDEDSLRGTIIPKKIEARSTPDTSGTALFDLFEGLEVIVQQTSGDWHQVTYPGGSTGWIPKSALFTTRDRVAP
jgi:tetratricopeptide (TPR) repeat protein